MHVLPKNMKLIAIFLALYASPRAFADGMPLTDGRFSGGAATEIKLSPWQWLQLRVGDAYVLELTNIQSDLVKRNSGSGISRVFIYNTRRGENDCTCCAVNRGLWFSEWGLDIPHAYLDPAEAMPPSNGTRQSLIILSLAIGIPTAFAGWLRLRMRTRIRNNKILLMEGGTGQPATQSHQAEE